MKEELRKIWQYASDIDWNDWRFDKQKAHVCSIFSNLAYLHIPANEHIPDRRFMLTPSSEYRAIIEKKNYVNVTELLAGIDLADNFIIETRYVVVLGIAIRDTLFIAIRGTKYLYDWVINAKVQKVSIQKEYNSSVKFHKGFLSATIDCVNPLIGMLDKESYRNHHIYITGHSLGGAIAAILTPVLSRDILICTPRYFDITSTYTFGMPRFGDMNAILNYSPYHIKNPIDIVPGVPPTFLGYENGLYDYELWGNSLRAKRQHDNDYWLHWLSRLIFKEGIKNHDIELYRDKIAACL